jgi:uracil-DNA glycosylase
MPARASPKIRAESLPSPETLRRTSQSSRPSKVALDRVLADIRGCRACPLAHEHRPVVVANHRSRILIVGQAPGRRVHESGIPWNDPSGDRLRDWLGMDRETFYNPDNIAVAAMGFCYPGTVNGADLPPRKECAPKWRPLLIPLLPQVRLTLLVGTYAQRYHLGSRAGASLGETVRNWRAYLPEIVVLPHPSWRNTAWLKRNPWFEEELAPQLRASVASALA